MDFLKNIETDSLLLIPYNIKEKVLDYINDNNLLINIKIISFNDLKAGLFYSYDNKTIYNVMNKYNTTYSLAKSYIQDTYYITEDKYDNNKLNKLLEIKNYLLDNNLLIKDDLFIDLLKSKNKIYVYGFDYISKYNNYLLDIAKSYIEVEIIEKEYNEYDHIVYSANTMEEEVLFVAEKISSLINDGIDINKIYLAGIDDEYDFTMRRIFKEYNIPYFIKNNNILYDTAIAKYFFDNLNNNIEELLNDIKKKYKIDNNNPIYNKLFNLVNKYYFTDNYLEVKELMIEEAKRTTLPSIHMTHEITTIDINDNIINDDEYVFLMNFNMGVFPKVKKDEDYISDNIKPSFLESTKKLNVINKNNLLKSIKNIKNLYISYKLSSPFNKYYPSYLIEDNFKEEKIDFTTSSYSDNINKLLFGKRLDNLIKFNEVDNTLPILNNTYDIPYNKYDNCFKGLDNHIENINYSYSNMSSYFKCPFRFYCEKVLYIDEFNKNINTFIGSLFHHILEVCLSSNIDIDEEYDKYLEDNKDDYEFNNHDYYFIEKLRSEIHYIVDIIRGQYNNLMGDYKELYEEEVLTTTKDLGIDTKINATLKGFVDKIIQDGNDLIIIDYKTGNSDIVNRDMFEYGLHIQLPLYLYLLETIKPELNVAGIYLQHILTGKNKKDLKKTQEELRQSELRLDGLTLNDPSVIDKFDYTYENSTMIKALKTDKNGNLPTSRTYTYEQKDELKNIMKELIKTCVDNVYEANFNIKPILINGNKEDGCKYCSMRDVCYKKDNQYNRIQISKEGDEDE